MSRPEEWEECPVCTISWNGPDIADHFESTGKTREEAEESASAYGWTPDRKRCFRVNMVGIEYPYGHPGRYDGVSEYKCDCGARFNRFTGQMLEENEYARRY